jgi:hypothetical protein
VVTQTLLAIAVVAVVVEVATGAVALEQVLIQDQQVAVALLS